MIEATPTPSLPAAEPNPAEKAADAEHGDEAEQNGRRRNAAEVEAEVDRVQDPAEQVVEDQGEQKEPAPDQKATSKNEVSRAHSRYTATAS